MNDTDYANIRPSRLRLRTLHPHPTPDSRAESAKSEPTPLLNKTFFAAQNWGSAGKIRQ